MRPPPASTHMLRRALCVTMALGAGGAGIVGCSSPPKPPPPKPPLLLSINIVAAAQLNPDARMRPSPVVVRVYELKSAAQFSSADFLSLYDKDQSVLGADVVTREEFVLRPGEKKAINKQLPAETKFIGVVAAFRELDSARWRGLVPIAPGKDNTMTISLDTVSIHTTGPS
jgi:type VI secretion system protein VasD